MRLTFIYPIALWLLLLLPLLWAFTFSTRRVSQLRLGRWRYWMLLTLRSIALVALVLALAGTQFMRTVDNLTVVYLIDGSDSVSPNQRQQALQYVNESLSTRRSGDNAAVVVFGQNALVERAPNDFATLGQLNSIPIASRTNIAEAIQLGLALFPADAQKRMVLLSDGSENQGRAIESARLATVRDIPIDVVPLPSETGPDVLVSALDAPDAVREGQDVTIQARITSSIATTGQLQVFADGELVDTQDVTLDPGTTDVPITVASGEAGFRRYEVRLEAQDDTQALNNRAATFTDVQGPPRVLLIASDPTRAAPLENALNAANARAEVVAPDRVSAQQADLKRYAAVVLVDVLAREVPNAVQEALPIYVRDQGGSLAMIGGRESFGAGGWRRSPVAEALPVELDPRDTEERPDVALALVIDRSGSMSSSDGTGRTKLDLAKEAVYQASLGLERNDQIGVVAFDTLASWVMPMQPLPDVLDIELALGQFNEGGGTNIRSGIELTSAALPSIDSRIKHVILLTDGIADTNYNDLIDELRDNQITITVVSIGTDASPVLPQIAERGGGRFYRVQTMSDVPRIFLEETVTVAGRDIVEEQFTPAVTLPIPAVRGLGGLPPLYGYNATEPRPAARTILVSPNNKPILAQWQYGLGRSVAWTSDLKGQWARDWVGWDQFPRFAGGLLDTLLPPQQSEGIDLQSRTEGAQAILELTIQNTQDQSIDAAAIEGRLLDPEDQGIPLEFAEVGVGRYRAVVSAETPGAYLAEVSVLDTEGQAVGSASGGLVVSYSPEYNPQDNRPSVLADLAVTTGGQQSPNPTAIFTPTTQNVAMAQEIAFPLLLLALLLWPFDIALRRLFVRRSDLGPIFRLFRFPNVRPQPQTANANAATMARLQTARSRAREQQRRGPTGNPGRQSVAAPASTSQPTSGIIAPPQSSRSTASTSLPSPPPAAKSKAQSPPPPARAQAQPTSGADESLARLLIAKQRAKRRRGQPDSSDRTDES